MKMENRGRYIYGVAEGGRTINLSVIGIDGSAVYTIPGGRFCAIAHSCPARPYQSADEQTLKDWVRAHQGVLDEAMKVLGAVIPMSFDTILFSRDDAVSPDQVVRDWLEENTEQLGSLTERIRGKDEYGVQIFYTPQIIARRISAENPEIRKIREETPTKPPGTAYLYQQKVERAVKAEVERLANDWFKDFYARVRGHCENIVLEKSRKTGDDSVMLLNLSCLVAKEKVETLGEELERINTLEGFSVRFTGPWPPYSFVARPATQVRV